MCASLVMPALFTRMSTGPSDGRHLVDERSHRRFVADIARPRPRASAGRAHRRFHLASRRFAGAERDADRRAPFGEQLRDAAADASRPAGDHRHPAGQAELIAHLAVWDMRPGK